VEIGLTVDEIESGAVAAALGFGNRFEAGVRDPIATFDALAEGPFLDAADRSERLSEVGSHTPDERSCLIEVLLDRVVVAQHAFHGRFEFEHLLLRPFDLGSQRLLGTRRHLDLGLITAQSACRRGGCGGGRVVGHGSSGKPSN